MIKEDRGVRYEILYTGQIPNFRVDKGDDIYYIYLNHNLNYDYKKRAVERCIKDIIRSKAFSKKYLRDLIDVVGRGKRHRVVVQEGHLFLLRVRKENEKIKRFG